MAEETEQEYMDRMRELFRAQQKPAAAPAPQTTGDLINGVPVSTYTATAAAYHDPRETNPVNPVTENYTAPTAAARDYAAPLSDSAAVFLGGQTQQTTAINSVLESVYSQVDALAARVAELERKAEGV